MTNKVNNSLANPLAAPQREKAGSQTFDKYLYQYHWALCRALDAHKQSNDYVVFVELHEDVILSNSTDPEKAFFEFNQVKNLSNSPLNHKSISKFKTKTKKIKATATTKATTETKITENSILGKMLLSTKDKPFFEKINQHNLVATCGFKLDLDTNNSNFSVIKIGQLSEQALKEINDAITKEIGVTELPATLTFIVPNLPTIGFQETTIGRISQFVEAKYSGKKCNASNIYRLLIDELYKKGTVSYDFAIWSDLLENKGLTGENIEHVINANTENMGFEALLNDFNDIALELGFTKLHQKRAFKNEMERYHQSTYAARTSLDIHIHDELQKLTTQNIHIFNTQGTAKYINYVITLISEDIKEKMNLDINKIKAALAVELLVKCNE